MRVWAEDNPFGGNGDAHHNFGAVLTATRLATGDPPHDPGGPGLALAFVDFDRSAHRQKLQHRRDGGGASPAAVPGALRARVGKGRHRVRDALVDGEQGALQRRERSAAAVQHAFCRAQHGRGPDPALVEIA